MPLSRREHAFEKQFRRKLVTWSRGSPWPGMLVCAVLTVLAIYIHALPFAPFTLVGGQHPVSDVLLALLIGMGIRNLIPAARALRPGIQIVVTKVLPVGIFLLGAGLDVHDILKVGFMIILDALLVVTVILALVRILTRALGVEEKQGLLIGVGTAICGNAAIVTTAPMLEAEDRDVALSIAVINLMGIIAMVTFPVLSVLLSLSPIVYGMWCGFSIQVTAHVIAAGFAHQTHPDLAGGIATITKLVRISFLGPAVFVVGTMYAYRRRKQEAFVGQPVRYTQFIPTFVLLFFVMVACRTLGFFPEVTFHMTERALLGPGDYTVDIARALVRLSKALITCGIAGVGLMTEFRMVRAGGIRPLLLGALSGATAYAMGLLLAVLSHAP